MQFQLCATILWCSRMNFHWKGSDSANSVLATSGQSDRDSHATIPQQLPHLIVYGDRSSFVIIKLSICSLWAWLIFSSTCKNAAACFCSRLAVYLPFPLSLPQLQSMPNGSFDRHLQQPHDDHFCVRTITQRHGQSARTQNRSRQPTNPARKNTKTRVNEGHRLLLLRYFLLHDAVAKQKEAMLYGCLTDCQHKLAVSLRCEEHLGHWVQHDEASLDLSEGLCCSYAQLSFAIIYYGATQKANNHKQPETIICTQF